MPNEPKIPAPPSGVTKERSAGWYATMLEPSTVATVASAIAAVASAIAAVVALIYLAHQENTAREQLRATYLSSLYTKQVDSFAALELSIRDFEDVADRLHFDDAGSGNVHLSDLNQYHSDVVKEFDAYRKSARTVWDRVEVLRLVTPKSLEQIISAPGIYINSISVKAYDFTVQAPTQNTFDSLMKDTSVAYKLLNQWKQSVPKCIQTIFIQGTPITADDAKTCGTEFLTLSK
jgi:hypothetical protein